MSPLLPPPPRSLPRGGAVVGGGLGGPLYGVWAALCLHSHALPSPAPPLSKGTVGLRTVFVWDPIWTRYHKCSDAACAWATPSTIRRYRVVGDATLSLKQCLGTGGVTGAVPQRCVAGRGPSMEPSTRKGLWCVPVTPPPPPPAPLRFRGVPMHDPQPLSPGLRPPFP